MKVLTKINIPPHKLKKALLVIYAFLIVTTLYHVIFAHRIIPGVKVGSVVVGGKTFQQAKEALENYEKTVDKTVTLNFEDKQFLFKGDQVGLVYNWDASISRAYEVGRTGDFFIDTRDKVAGLIKNIYIAAFYDYDDDLFHVRFAQIQVEINKEEKVAAFYIPVAGQLDTTESVEGRKVSSDDLFKVIINSFDTVAFSLKELPVEKIIPKVTQRDIEQFRDQAKKIVYNPLKISYGKKTWTLTTKQMLEFLAFDKENDVASLELNKPKFEAFMDTLALEINVSPRGRVVETDGNRVVKFEITQGGHELDEKKFTKDFKAAYFSALPSVELALKENAESMAPDKYGIFALLGEGNSKFHGSIPGRVKNLSLAAERTNGVLVPPGGVYSLNNSIGEISGKTGYDAAYIIQNGRTVLGEGGGVCQTSTTLFRAVLNSGLPVVMRYPHAYRVHYYEEDSPPGYDASIFQPTLDFQFKNDTANYILVQSSVDKENFALNFKLYGTPDGRSVELTQPVITNQVGPGDPVYIDDPTLKKGVTYQIESPAWGSNVSFTRTVKRGGEVLHTETFASRYQAWKAVYKVGTKE